MKINYKDADGKTIELDVSESVGTFYLEAVKNEELNDRRNTRRHESLDEITDKDSRVFDSGVDVANEVASAENIELLLSKLTDRQRYLVEKVILEGYERTAIAKELGVSEGAVRDSLKGAIKKLKKLKKIL